MDYNKAALALHSKYPGKIAVQSLAPCKNRDALSTAYTPGVAEPCRKIKANPDDVYTYTMKGRTVAVVTDGTAVLGLGNIGPEAGLPVMEGKCVLFKEFGGVDAVPHLPEHQGREEEVIATVKAIAPDLRRHQPGGHPAAPLLRDRSRAGARPATSPSSTMTSTVPPSSCWPA